jgi:RimJ/RimL family protein N-acetyltransferase
LSTSSVRETPELREGGLVLGAWLDRDAARVLEIAEDPDTRAWSPSMRPLYTRADALAWMAGRTTSDDRVDWAVREAASGLLVGRVGLHRFDEQSRSAEIGYGVHPAHRRRGVARRAVTAASSYGFTALNLARISLIHATGNPGSCAVAGRAGFAFEGVERAALDHGDGVLHDIHRHARLVTDGDSDADADGIDVDPAHGGAALQMTGRAPVTVEAGALSLRPWTEDDANQVLAAFADPLIAAWNPRLPLAGLEAARQWVASRARGWASGGSCSWAVVDSDSGVLLGSSGLRHIDPIDHGAVASYWTLAPARGGGVAPAALIAATEWGFTELGLHRVQLAHVLANVSSCRVAAKAGFTLEATTRGSCLLRDGFSDEHLHARLVSDPAVQLARPSTVR